MCSAAEISKGSVKHENHWHVSPSLSLACGMMRSSLMYMRLSALTALLTEERTMYTDDKGEALQVLQPQLTELLS